MRATPRLLLFVGSVIITYWLAACGDSTKEPDSSTIQEMEYANRAEEVAVRIEPVLREKLQTKGFEWGAPVFIQIFKESSQLELWLQAPKSDSFQLFKTYHIARFSGKPGPKLQEGDRQAPEGFYHVTADQLNPWSKFHLSFNLGFPNAYDQYHGRTGTFLMVHGSNVSVGCYAMGDAAIEEIYTLVNTAMKSGQQKVPVHCYPFHLTEARIARIPPQHQWRSFWENLREGYAIFESTHRVPEVNVNEGRYVFSRL